MNSILDMIAAVFIACEIRAMAAGFIATAEQDRLGGEKNDMAMYMGWAISGLCVLFVLWRLFR